MKRRDLKLDKYNISAARYRELLYFCLQYDDRRQRIDDLREPQRSPQDGQPHGSSVSDPTAKNGSIAAVLSRENEIIEQSAIEAGGGDLYRWLLEAVTNNYSYNFMRMTENMPCGRNEFNEIRHKFFYVLDQKKSQVF